MVRELPEPARPLTNGTPWVWQWVTPAPQRPWGWCRLYHVSQYTPDAVTHRDYGPLFRFDPHEPGQDGKASVGTPRRSVLYVADSLATAIGETFGDLAPTASICPGYRVALLRPATPLTLVDLVGFGAAMRLGALPALASMPGPRGPTQQWARAIYEDRPLPNGRRSSGVRYRTANADGHALALWDTDDQVTVVADDQGRAQDFGLIEDAWPYVLESTRRLGLHAETVSSCSRCSSTSTSASSSTFTEQDALDAVRSYIQSREQANVKVASAFIDGVELANGVLTATWSQNAIGKPLSDVLLEVNPFENLAQFVGTPLAFDNDLGRQIRQHIHTIYVVLPEAVGSLSTAELYERATGQVLR